MLKIKRISEIKTEMKNIVGSDIQKKVRKIIEDVTLKGDEAIKEYTRLFDKIELKKIQIEKEEIKKAKDKINPELKEAILISVENLYKFSNKQLKILKKLGNLKVKIKPGVIAEQKVFPIKRVGIYVPGGNYPLISSLYMAAVPAKVAGVKEIVICSPPKSDRTLPSAILYLASLLNIEELYAVGGAQAIAAMAVGTESIRPVDKIVGPGNIYVTAAKKELFGIVGIDLIAGPTELLIIADESVRPDLIACDLIAQAEHDPLALCWLVTKSRKLAEKVKEEVNKQLEEIKTYEIARRSLQEHGLIILINKLEEVIDFANQMAPEHLSLMVKEPEPLIPRFKHYGTLFIGENATAGLGDYSSGINHILPTNGAARYRGGLSVKDFLKFQTVLKVSRKGLNEIGSSAITLAETEGLFGHANAIRRRIIGEKKQTKELSGNYSF